MARYIGSLLKLATTNGKELALDLNAGVKSGSNYRRIQRFMSEFAFDFKAFGGFLLSLLPQKEGFLVVMDRTEWHFGSKPVNVLMIGFAYKGIAFPVLWKVLAGKDGSGKEGSSSTAERKELFKRFLELVPSEKIRAFVADREFIGEEWIGFLNEREVPFVIRIRSNRKIALSGSGQEAALPARMFFREPLLPAEGQERRPAGEEHSARGGQPVNVTGKRLPGKAEKDEFLIVISSRLCDGEKPLDLYRRRWEIESLFAAMKSRGFNLETTHVTMPERIAKLIGLLALAFVWSHLVGQKRHQKDSLKTKNHGWPEQSLFRYGLDLLRSIMLNLAEKKDQFRRCVRLLDDPSKSFVV